MEALRARCLRLLAAGMLAAAAQLAHAAAIVVVSQKGEASPLLELARRIGSVYGLEALPVELASGQGAGDPFAPPGRVVGVVATQAAYRSAEWAAVQANMVRAGTGAERPALLVVGAAPAGRRDGRGVGTVAQEADAAGCRVQVAESRAVARQLAGFSGRCGWTGTMPVASFDAGSEAAGVEVIAELRAGNRRHPIFVRDRRLPGEAYFLGDVPFAPDPRQTLFELLSTQFQAAAPIAMFLTTAAKDRAWHAEQAYANMTIDDPWLREPYGNVSFERLRQEMREHRFHTTIAFVPWNFDRNQPQVVDLFKRNPDIYSLAIHGNDHAHEEFAPRNGAEAAQAAIRQALARMAAMQQATGLTHDRVMIFPQQVSGPSTIDLLRSSGFLCTVNLTKRREETLPGVTPHPWTSFVAEERGMPSLKREVPDIGESIAPLLAFLHVPVLLHTHQNYFADRRFGAVADKVSASVRGVKWTNLGEICRALFLTRREDDGSIAVRLFGSQAELRNGALEAKTYHIVKEYAPDVEVSAVEVNGRRLPLQVSAGRTAASVTVPAGATVRVDVRYAGQLDDAALPPVEKGGIRVRLLRWASDFRDNMLSQTEIGRTFHDAYYSLMRGRYAMIDSVLAAVALAGVLFAGWGALALTRRRRLRR